MLNNEMIELLRQPSSIPDPKTAWSKTTLGQYTTSHARMLVRVGVSNTFGATPWTTAGITAVPKVIG